MPLERLLLSLPLAFMPLELLRDLSLDRSLDRSLVCDASLSLPLVPPRLEPLNPLDDDELLDPLMPPDDDEPLPLAESLMPPRDDEPLFDA